MTEITNSTGLVDVEAMLVTAQSAASEFKSFDQAQVEKILQAVASAANDKAEFYAEWSVRETGFGCVEDKVKKNKRNSLGLLEAYKCSDYIDSQIDEEKKIISFPKPAGVVVALAPCTNPVATIYYKAMISLMTRNAIIFCPHPASKDCCSHAADLVAAAAEAAGAPRGTIQVLRNPSIPVVNELMQSRLTNLILATGGPAMVRAAYSSGNPAMGVGPANVACYVHRTADLDRAAETIVFGNCYDNSLPCTCESVVLVDNDVADQLKSKLQCSGAYFVKPFEEASLRTLLFDSHDVTDKREMPLGKSAKWLAERAGFSIPDGTKSLVIEINQIGESEPVSKEKMFPVLGFIRVADHKEAIAHAQSMLSLMGKGHSAVVHSEDPKVVIEYGKSLPVCRIAVNTSGAAGSAGVTTNLGRSSVIGTGYFGGGSIDENVGPKHLVQWTRVAYGKEVEVNMHNVERAAKNK
ncbi:MAG: hypothetical protein A2X80_10400 [Geobacteraceae bacterium GWB2_52_12]|nr:MAG: hypothetical protein A2X80_10400 [Geobacteraceae bacterium GWB2_52_12]